MSAAGRDVERQHLDCYNTPAWAAETICSWLYGQGYLFDRHVLEPSVGAGAFVRASAAYGLASMTVNDINPDSSGLLLVPEEARLVGNFCDAAWPGKDRSFGLVLGNPPYREAQKHVETALTMSPIVAFLLRLGFLAGQKSSGFWQKSPPAHIRVFSRCPSFTSGGTDATDYALMVWDRRTGVPAAGSPRLGWI